VAQAIFGLIGVIIGAAVTGGVDLVLERRREDAAARQAKRLVASELHTMWVHLALLAREGRTPTTPPEKYGERFLPFALWEGHRASLARVVSDADWEALFLLYDNVMGLRLFIMELPPGAELPPEQKEQFTDLTDSTGPREKCLNMRRA
jgi:hypothetical protein